MAAMEAWSIAERELREAGHDLDKIPQFVHEHHLWADGLLLFWHRNKRLPSADELAEDMFDEWDDPVSTAHAQVILDMLKS